MLQMALQAAPYVLNAAGGIFGKKKKYLDPEMMRQKYGPAAIGKDTQAIANFILNSPYGQQLLASAATQGQELQTNLAQQAAASGMSPDTGGSSGASTFAAAAAPQAQAGLERDVKAGVWQAAMPIAAAQNQQWMALEQANTAAQNQEPSAFQKIAAAAGQVANVANKGADDLENKLTAAGGAAAGVPPMALNVQPVKKPGEKENLYA